MPTTAATLRQNGNETMKAKKISSSSSKRETKSTAKRTVTIEATATALIEMFVEYTGPKINAQKLTKLIDYHAYALSGTGTVDVSDEVGAPATLASAENMDCSAENVVILSAAKKLVK